MRKRYLAGMIVMAASLALWALLSTVPAAGQIVIVTATPFETPTPVPTLPPLQVVEGGPGCDDPFLFEPGDTILVRPGVIIRNNPTTSGGQVGYVGGELRQSFTILDGPVCANDYLWWNVFSENFNPGWMAQGPWMRPEHIQALITDCSEPLDLRIGGRAELLAGVRVRENPNSEARVLTVAPFGGFVTILDKPFCANNYNWWPVSAIVLGFEYTGWVAEGAPGNYWLLREGARDEPVCPSFSARGFSVGTRGFVSYRDYSAKYLRTQPGLDGQVITSLLNGVAFVVVDGPVCVDDIYWWQVQILGREDVVGWLAEGGPGNYWIRRFGTELTIPGS